MDKKAIEERLKAIGGCTSIEDARSLIVDFQKDVLTDYDEHEKVLAERDNFKTDNETLRQANMKLFLQVGSPESEAQIKAKEEDSKKLTFDKLFNEKGGLK